MPRKPKAQPVGLPVILVELLERRYPEFRV